VVWGLTEPEDEMMMLFSSSNLLRKDLHVIKQRHHFQNSSEELSARVK